MSIESSPSSSPPPSLSGVSTPATERSVLFDIESAQKTSSTNDQNRDFILVTGGLGFIGSHTCWELLKAGRNVIIVDDLSNSYQEVVGRLKSLRDTHYKSKPCSTAPTIQFYQADYRDEQTMHAILSKHVHIRDTSDDPAWPSIRSEITGVIHFAAYKAVSESIREPLSYYSNNVAGLIDFCGILGKYNIKTIIFSSSATVYGRLADTGGRLFEEQCDSSTCIGLTNPYGRTKWMCEAILHDLALSDPNWTIFALRYFNPIGCDAFGVLGEDPRNTPNNLMPVVIETMASEDPDAVLNIFGTDWDTLDGTAVRDFIHVSDLARGHVMALKSTEKSRFSGFHAFNLGTGTGYSVKEIVDTMEEVANKIIPRKLCDRREGDVGVCIADPSKSALELGWRTEKTLVQACHDLCRYLNLGTKE